jgi:RNA polymerase sigma-70 factor (ECF subfamily)
MYLKAPENIQAAIVHKAAHGDADAQAWLYMQYSKAMYNICIRMTGNKLYAEDVLHDAFVGALKNIKQLKEPENFGGWLKRIVINECIKHCKKTFYWDDWDETTEEHMADEPVEWWTTLSMEMIHTAIKNLPEGCRQIFVLYALEDNSHKEIADQLGITEGTSKSQYHRAKKLLKEKVSIQIAANG